MYYEYLPKGTLNLQFPIQDFKPPISSTSNQIPKIKNQKLKMNGILLDDEQEDKVRPDFVLKLFLNLQ